jgi:PilZ domain-containing protein
MEHRWGRRLEIGGRVQLRGVGSAVAGQLRNLSISGAFIETRLSVPPSTRLTIEWDVKWYGRTESCRIAAYVVRSDASGIAVEWCDVAPEWILAMLASHPRTIRHCGRDRASPSNCGSETGLQPRFASAKGSGLPPPERKAGPAGAYPFDELLNPIGHNHSAATV